jgi:hypothetical protein
MISGARYHRVATSTLISLSFRWLRERWLTLRHESSLTLFGLDDTRLEPSSETEIADLQFTIGIDEQVSGFQISVKDVGRVDIL